MRVAAERLLAIDRAQQGEPLRLALRSRFRVVLEALQPLLAPSVEPAVSPLETALVSTAMLEAMARWEVGLLGAIVLERAVVVVEEICLKVGVPQGNRVVAVAPQVVAAKLVAMVPAEKSM